MTELAIRPLRADDVTSLSELARRIWHETYPGIISRAQIDYMLAQRYAPDVLLASLDSTLWLGAWLQHEMAGFAQAYSEDAQHWKLDKLYIHPHYQRQGLGRTLLDRVCVVARASQATHLQLRVNRHNTVAVQAYGRFGFRVYAEDVLEIGEGFVMDDYLMELPLTPLVDLAT